MTSDFQTAWSALCRRALAGARPGEPFEVDEVVPEVARLVKVTTPEAAHLLRMLLTELDRLPEGQQFFSVEGNAVVPLPEFLAVARGPDAEQKAYPFEL